MSDRPRVLGIEGTAWAASAAVYDPGEGVSIETDAYQPESGGIDPSEAAEHMHNAIPKVVGTALDHAAGLSDDDPPIDAVAFSRGPGLGPCLRIVGTAARALAQSLDVPLIGVNHMVAHLEIGRHRSGFDSPVCLNASGANAHVLGFHNGRYQVLGETMDTGAGNAIDKFTRHVGWSHPGGPKVEEAARDGEYTELPYVVKGMDFSFSGIMSAAKQEYDGGTPVEDVCVGLQETIFAMLTEVAERALSLTGSDELVLGGGVGQNERLREMLALMCEQRGAQFYAPEPRFLRDNAGMIAVLGATMYEAGDTIGIDESGIDSDFRPDQVPVTWRDEESVARGAVESDRQQGAEATVRIEGDRVYKERAPKTYRHPDLDARLRRERTTLEARLTSEARRNGVPTPLVLDVDRREATITFERVGRSDLQADLTEERVRTVGKHLAALHAAGIVHGDPTTRNIRIDDRRVYMIDFGLGYYSDHVEDYAMDLHVFEQSLDGTAADPSAMRAAFEDGYAAAGEQRVLDQLREIEGRGRYQ
ncbi:bifunctional N(6)-L-threonylcarbamoyladenine synthase/serine/threonine protein kinase [Natranaeroarchaeum sulfidigenes]|uniref:Probable bifunctional tRNA threonylcarbamoyladenosine biosynthesis protein n=1 Tax=Natranaeroarchaeum sulfidigenes TaxID=2784880 RepID=A0A897MUI2_9EURY|nr:bifunctional N(6)-L-threonylcarbamoyladenine synthase/serine/threonine protein kinase [Natranaeroarchaeum sulfidigenes]QSG03688.1 Subunit of KEOPS complex, tRNA A37 threonylcarbamoyltransferase, contains a domain with ASKHA fold and RIO-type kinase (AP-endonuclease activity) [Natranaeroarchaeum sulfidigenes]